jgi:tRNA threonylcarbamoyladenosine biosynthesis protein TsaB
MSATDLILALDTTDRSGSAALATAEEILETRAWRAEPSHTPHLHAATSALLSAAGPRLVAIAVAAGPGGFSTVRGGMAIAKGICLGLDITLMAIPSLEAVALSADVPMEGHVLALIDAGARGCFAGEFTMDDTGANRLTEPSLFTPAEVALAISAGAHPVGNLPPARLEQIAAAFPAGSAAPPLTAPGSLAAAVAMLGWSKLAESTGRDALGAVPTYLREPDATLPKKGWGRT